MAVFVRNFQQRVLFSEPILERDARILVQLLRADKFDVSIVCAGGKRIKSLNLKYRRRNIQTDVLAFPFFENIKPGTLPKPSLPCEYNIGDVILGMPVIYQDCQEDNQDIQEYLPVLVTHGLCHLLGYTHDTEANLHQMQKKEEEVLTAFNKQTGYNSVPLLPSTDNMVHRPGHIEQFLEYHPLSPLGVSSSDARADKILQRYLLETHNTDAAKKIVKEEG